jgi:hypothetical protein
MLPSFEPDSYKPLPDPPDVIPGFLPGDEGTMDFFPILPQRAA